MILKNQFYGGTHKIHKVNITKLKISKDVNYK